MSNVNGQHPSRTKTVSSSKTLTANNTTATVPIFKVTGVVDVLNIYGIVTTDLGSNHTAAYLRLNDQTAQVNITLNTGVTLSSAKAGSIILKKGLATAALVKVDAVAGAVTEPTTLETIIESPIILAEKTGAVETDIEYVYTTNQTPTTGAIQFFAEYLPLSAGASLTAL